MLWKLAVWALTIGPKTKRLPVMRLSSLIILVLASSTAPTKLTAKPASASWPRRRLQNLTRRKKSHTWLVTSWPSWLAVAATGRNPARPRPGNQNKQLKVPARQIQFGESAPGVWIYRSSNGLVTYNKILSKINGFLNRHFPGVLAEFRLIFFTEIQDFFFWKSLTFFVIIEFSFYFECLKTCQK